MSGLERIGESIEYLLFFLIGLNIHIGPFSYIDRNDCYCHLPKRHGECQYRPCVIGTGWMD